MEELFLTCEKNTKKTYKKLIKQITGLAQFSVSSFEPSPFESISDRFAYAEGIVVACEEALQFGNVSDVDLSVAVCIAALKDS